MFDFTVDNLKNDDLRVFFDMIPYISSKVKSFDKSENQVTIYCEDEHNEEVKKELFRLVSIIDTMQGSELEKVVIEDFTDRMPLNKDNVFGDLIKEKIVRELSPGAFAYSGLFLRIYEYFDKKINEHAYNTFDDVNEEVYPVLFPVAEYVKGGYFENFPHYIMFQTKLNNDIDTYEKFASCNASSEGMDEVLKKTFIPKNVLRHATCAAVYPSMENDIFDENEVRCFLVSGKCFRNEESNIKELSRLNEFYMKEYVFVGEGEKMQSYIDESKKLVEFWIDKFSLNSKCETANDSFFASNYKKLKYFQMIGNSKLEYKFLIPNNDEYISCASVNYHRTHFTKPYNIKKANGEYCYTSCFAFGVERLVYAFLSQKGLDVSKWDEDTIEEIRKYVNL